VEGSLRNGARMLSATLPKVALISLLFSLPAGLLSNALGIQETEEAPASSTRGAERSDLFGQRLLAARVVNLYDAFIGLLGTVACLALFVGVAEGRTLSVGQALAEARAAWGRVFVARFRSGLIAALFTLLLVVPGIWKAVLFCFVTEASFRVADSDALDFSTTLVQSQRRWLTALGMSVLNGFVVGIPAFLAARALITVAKLVGVIPPLVVSVATDWLARLFEMGSVALGLAVFYGFLRSDGRNLGRMRWARQES
jgi:hypothetical protein